MNQEPGTFWTDQFNNTDALNGYREIGVELLEQLGSLDAFCGVVGTAGMLVGVSRAFKATVPPIRIVALSPPHRRDRPPSCRRTSGRGDGCRFRAAASHPGRLRRGAWIDEEEARTMARRLAKEEGIFAGVSTGLNVVAALQLARELGPGHRVATVAVYRD